MPGIDSKIRNNNIHCLANNTAKYIFLYASNFDWKTSDDWDLFDNVSWSYEAEMFVCYVFCIFCFQLVDVESQILSGQMEFMAEVDLAEIPGFYITHTAYRLYPYSHI